MTTNVSPAVLQSGTLLTGAADVFLTGAVNSQTIIKRPVFSNTTTVAATFSVSRQAFGGSPLLLIPPRSIAANGTDLAPELVNSVLNGGDELIANVGTVAAINAFVFGYVAT
jgi:hypothetical protein